MRLLLDTNALIWGLRNDPTLNSQAREAMHDPSNEVFVSVASAWEIAIKSSTGKLEAPDNLAEQIEGAGFMQLLATFEHAELAGRLPLHHRDPFDRMLVAQAQVEDLVLVTRDGDIARYEVDVMVA